MDRTVPRPRRQERRQESAKGKMESWAKKDRTSPRQIPQRVRTNAELLKVRTGLPIKGLYHGKENTIPYHDNNRTAPRQRQVAVQGKDRTAPRQGQDCSKAIQEAVQGKARLGMYQGNDRSAIR
jgi:hypothetical protein